MNEIIIALAIGAIAGTLDIIPMILKKVNRYSIASVFSIWVFLGLVIPFVDWPVEAYQKGLILGFMGMMPIAIQAYFRNRKVVPSILIHGAILGMLMALAGKQVIG